MAEVSDDVQPAVGLETDERKARVLDATRDAEMCVLQFIGRDKNPYRSTGDVELEEAWDRAWLLHQELRALRSSVICLEEVLRRHELRAKGTKR